jgi:hypothetical protein
MAGARRLENEIRVGLERESLKVVVDNSTIVTTDPLEQVSFGKTARRHVRDFGTLFGVIGIGVAAWQVYKEKPVASYGTWAAIGAAFLLLGRCAPRLLLPVWRAWMKFAHYLSIVMTTVLLVLTWCIGFLPMAFLLRVCGIRRIDMKYGDGRESYWEKRDPKYDDFKRLELQY